MEALERRSGSSRPFCYLDFRTPETAFALQLAPAAQQRVGGHRHQQQSLEEFHDLRNYVDGDSLQRVSWKHVARDQGWFVKRFEQEPNVQIQIIEYAKMPSAMHEVRLSMMMALEKWLT